MLANDRNQTVFRRPQIHGSIAYFIAVLAALLISTPITAQALPKGYLVWSKGDLGKSSSRKIYRMTLPNKTDVRALTSGEDIGCQVSPDGKWVAYAKAKLSGGTDYHSFHMWKIYIVGIEGINNGATEIKIDDSGYWPSWSKSGALYYNQADGKHSTIIKVTLDSAGKVTNKKTVLSTKLEFPSIPEINECFMAPDGSWYAGRTRGITSKSGVGAYLITPPTWNLLGKAGTSGCMPYVAPGGTWGFHAGSNSGIRWGDAPTVPNRKQDQQLIAPKGSGYRCYHPGISTDEKWVMTGQSKDSDQNAGAWEIYIYALDAATKKTSGETPLLTGGFNGWPHLYVLGSGTGPSPDSSTGPGPSADSGGGSGADGGVKPNPASDGGSVGDDAAGSTNNNAPTDDNVLTGGCAVGGGDAPGPPLLLLLALLLILRSRRR
jgi:MYXO-CTERM domain-containing protein